jgi:nicotinamidase-related amidase
MKNALIVIDIQNDYFNEGPLKLENADTARDAAVVSIEKAKQDGWLVVGIHHANPAGAPGLVEGTEGARIHPAVARALGDTPLVAKHQADSFFETNLETLLKDEGVTDIHIVGMMTQHCVTHTSLSPQARDFGVHIVGAGCAAPMQMLSDIALMGLSARCDVV